MNLRMENDFTVRTSWACGTVLMPADSRGGLGRFGGLVSLLLGDIMMEKISEQPLAANIATPLAGAIRDGLSIVGLDETADPKTVIDALDAFVYAWQGGQRPPKEELDPEDAPLALGSMWGAQLVRQFNWQWAMITFHDHGNTIALGVLSPDRALAVYPIHFLMGCLQHPEVDCTIALSFNMLLADKVGKLKPKEYFNLMDGVHRIVPRR